MTKNKIMKVMVPIALVLIIFASVSVAVAGLGKTIPTPTEPQCIKFAPLSKRCVEYAPIDDKNEQDTRVLFPIQWYIDGFNNTINSLKNLSSSPIDSDGLLASNDDSTITDIDYSIQNDYEKNLVIVASSPESTILSFPFTVNYNIHSSFTDRIDEVVQVLIIGKNSQTIYYKYGRLTAIEPGLNADYFVIDTNLEPGFYDVIVSVGVHKLGLGKYEHNRRDNQDELDIYIDESTKPKPKPMPNKTLVPTPTPMPTPIIRFDVNVTASSVKTITIPEELVITVKVTQNGKLKVVGDLTLTIKGNQYTKVMTQAVTLLPAGQKPSEAIVIFKVDTSELPPGSNYVKLKFPTQNGEHNILNNELYYNIEVKEPKQKNDLSLDSISIYWDYWCVMLGCIDKYERLDQFFVDYTISNLDKKNIVSGTLILETEGTIIHTMTFKRKPGETRSGTIIVNAFGLPVHHLPYSYFITARIDSKNDTNLINNKKEQYYLYGAR